MADIPPPSKQAQRLLGVITAAIEGGDIDAEEPSTFLSYSSALRKLGVETWKHAGWALGNAGLRDLSRWTARYETLPKVDGLIVNQKTHRPGPGFLKIHGFKEWDQDADMWWRGETSRAIHFQWSRYLSDTPSFRNVSEFADNRSLVQEEDEPEAPSYQGVVIYEAGPAHIRRTRVTVAEILGWLASGQTEAQILRRHAELSNADIRASLAYAADREKRMAKPSFTARWTGKFTLPAPDPSDERLTYLLERYERNRK